jgi:hypothetical protein
LINYGVVKLIGESGGLWIDEGGKVVVMIMVLASCYDRSCE